MYKSFLATALMSVAVIAQAETAPAVAPATAVIPETTAAAVIHTEVPGLAEKLKSCVPCHSTDGNSTQGLWPKLAGQSAQYLEKQLHAFKEGPTGKRNNPVMYSFVAQFTDQDIKDVSEYYASQKTSPGTKVGPQEYALGKQIYQGGLIAKGVPSCSACHGPGGHGNAWAKFPKLAGQHADYTLAQLKAYQSGTRQTGPMMSTLVKSLTEEEMTAVSHYIAAMKSE